MEWERQRRTVPRGRGNTKKQERGVNKRLIQGFRILKSKVFAMRRGEGGTN